ncbi:putative tRNA pseudouridine synthase Pus10 [Liparis tanakae]|uniref:Putative tRNA pseudouridine synthase Pus10 n=1 Tax=Liparis tanakae TaxID=230148 RepID=A0A4Z2EQR3_9TELE|nr:putative tRNA pseudouridine synthase Pus10 [Liparis tanakae]
MLPLKEKDKPIVRKLLSSGCCARCVLRFCCVTLQAAYRKPPQDTLRELRAFVHDAENGETRESVEGNGESRDEAAAVEPAGDPPSKRAKLEPLCVREVSVCVCVCMFVCVSVCVFNGDLWLRGRYYSQIY